MIFQMVGLLFRSAHLHFPTPVIQFQRGIWIGICAAGCDAKKKNRHYRESHPQYTHPYHFASPPAWRILCLTRAGLTRTKKGSLSCFFVRHACFSLFLSYFSAVAFSPL